MALLTYNIELASKPDTTGRWSVMIRLHLKDHRPGRVLTSVKIEKADQYWAIRKTGKKAEWGKWVIRHSDKEALNAEILAEHNRIKQQVSQWQKEEPGVLFTPTMLADRFRDSVVSETYETQLLRILEEAKDQSYGTWLGKRTAVLGFTAWAPKTLTLVEVTPQLVRQYQQYLQKKIIGEENQRMKASSINRYLDSLHILHKAILMSEGLSPKQAAVQSPWNDRQRLAQAEPRKMRLDESTIDRVAALKVESRRRGMTPELSFKVWMLAHLLAGARFSDVMQLRYMHFRTDEEGNPTHCSYEMMKTGFRINIPLFDEAKALISVWWQPEKHKPTDYLLPFLKNNEPFARLLTHEQYKHAPFEVRQRLGFRLSYWNHRMNVCLREIRTAAGLPDKLNTHNARHSFADRARRIMQEDKTLTLYDIQMMLGHGEYKTTVGYIEKLSGQDATNPMTAVFNRKRVKAE